VIERSFIHVAGPPKAGKTSLVEAVLSRTEEPVLVARCVLGSGSKAKESAPKTDRELERLRRAGAAAVTRYQLSPSRFAFDDFFQSELMEEFSQAVILEGGDPLGTYDLRVFVAPAPASSEPLLVRRTHDESASDLARLEHWVELLSQPDGLAAWTSEIFGARVGGFLPQNLPRLDDIRLNAIASLEQLRSRPRASAQPRWAIGERWQGIERAGLVVVNVRKGEDRTAAEQLVQDLLQLRRGPKLAREVLGPFGSRQPITARVADLRDPRDPGRRDSVARIRRVVRSRPLW